MAEAVQQQLLQATQMIEQQVDAEIERLGNMDEDDLEVVRQKRMNAMKRAAEQKKEWLTLGHGEYTEIASEKEFFEMYKKSKNVVCHFFRDSTFRCKIVDKHLALLAPKHIEARFIKLSVDKCQFLVDRLRIKVLPTIAICRDGQTVDYIVGFDDLGGIDEFPTEMLEWRLGTTQVINYNGDLLNPPTIEQKKKQNKTVFGFAKTKKTIRGGDDDDSSDDDNDW